jgi:hypothetical protein
MMFTPPIQTKCIGLLSALLVLTICVTGYAQKKSKSTEMAIPMQAERWTFPEGKVEFVQHKGVQSLKILPDGGQALLKNVDFTDGTIEFDVEPTDAAKYPFLMIKFRQQDPQESECFYLRVGRPNGLKRNDAVQYTPIIKGVNMWDMYYHFQGPADVRLTDRNHVKIVVAGSQLRAYVNDMQNTTLEIPRMEGNTTHGSIGFEGVGIFSNLVIKPDVTEGMQQLPGIDLTKHDAHYIRKWLVTKPVAFEAGRDLTDKDVPSDTATWEPISAERRGLINLTRTFGGNQSRRYVWLKVKIVAEKEHKNHMQLGFGDEVWVVLNGRLLYLDKNHYGMLIRKTPDGRIGLENSNFALPLNQGENILMICVANNFFGWGIIARLETMEGVEIQ